MDAPPLTDAQSRPVATSRDEEYSVSVTEAAELFTQSGLPRTERAIQRYCKKGELLYAFQETTYGARYLIQRSSIDRLIAQKLQTTGHDSVATGRDQSRQAGDTVRATVAPSPEQPREINTQSHDTEEQHAPTGRDNLQKLREENLGLKIDVAGKLAFINQLVSERQQLMTAAQDLSYRLGAAEARVAQLEAPKPVTPETEPQVVKPEMVVTPSIGEGSAKPIQPEPPTPSRSFMARLFGS